MKRTKLFLLITTISAAMSFTAWAGQWQQNETGWWYQNDDGSYPSSCWQEINGKFYYFDGDGYMLADTVTPDGYLVDDGGAWMEHAVTEFSTATSKPVTVKEAGAYRVGTDLEAGEYILFAEDEHGAYYEVCSDTSGSLESIITNDTFYYNAIVTVYDGDYLVLDECTLSPIEEVPMLDCSKATMLKVGYHIPAGDYKLWAKEKNGYYAVYSNSGNTLFDVVYNNFFDDRTYITLSEGEYLQLSRCALLP